MMNIFYYNLLAQEVTDLSATNENAQFPLSNLKDPRTSRVFRSTAKTDSVVIDLKKISQVDSVLVRASFGSGWGHGNLTIEANVSDSWTAPPFSTTVTIDPQFNIAWELFNSTESYRYWRITGSGGDVFELSNIFLGTKFQPTACVDYGWRIVALDLSKESYNAYGQKFNDIIGNKRELSAGLSLMCKDTLDSMVDFTGYAAKYNPFWIIMDSSESIVNSAEMFSGQFYLKARPQITNSSYARYGMSLEMEECI
jgi:hypothetical protein